MPESAPAPQKEGITSERSASTTGSTVTLVPSINVPPPPNSGGGKSYGEEDYDADSEVIFAMDNEEESANTRAPHVENAGNSDEGEGEDDEEEAADEVEEGRALSIGFSASDRYPASGIRHSGRFAAARPNTSARLPSSSIAASLPVTISKGFWPPIEAVDSPPNGDNNDKTILPQRDDDIYRNIQAFSRSIQPADDPERLFGERPRRRYRTGKDSNCACEAPDPRDLMASPRDEGDKPELVKGVASHGAHAAEEVAPIMVRSLVGGGFPVAMMAGTSIPTVVRDMNEQLGRGYPAGPGNAVCEQIIVGERGGEELSTSRPRIIIPESLPLIHGGVPQL